MNWLFSEQCVWTAWNRPEGQKSLLWQISSPLIEEEDISGQFKWNQLERNVSCITMDFFSVHRWTFFSIDAWISAVDSLKGEVQRQGDNLVGGANKQETALVCLSLLTIQHCYRFRTGSLQSILFIKADIMYHREFLHAWRLTPNPRPLALTCRAETWLGCNLDGK